MERSGEIRRDGLSLGGMRRNKKEQVETRSDLKRYGGAEKDKKR